MATLKSLPARPSLEYLKKLAKERLKKLRSRDPEAKLAAAHLAIAREFGFSSWRKLNAHVHAVWATIDSGKVGENDVKELVQALRRKNRSIVARMLRQRPALANASEAGGSTMLHIAAGRNDVNSVGMLLDAGAKTGVRWYGHTPLSWAVTAAGFGAAKVLVQRGVEPDLFCAAGMGDAKAAAKFFDDHGRLRAGASQTGSSRYGADGKLLLCPPIEEAEVVADALYIAARHGRAEVVELLLAHHPDLSFRAYLGGTTLHWAYFGTNEKIVRMLLAADMDSSNRANVFKCTPRGFGIHVAAEWGDLTRVRRQLKSDDALATIFDGGMTPLHRVARGGRAAIVKWLLRAGADPNARDAERKTAIDVARDKGHLQVVDAIEDGL